MNAKIPYLCIPIDVLAGDNFKQLSGSAIRLLIDSCLSLRLQRGRPINNGELTLTAKRMKPRGWNSADTLYSAKCELLHYGYLKISKRASCRSQAPLYALTIYPINEGNHDIPSTLEAPNDWRQVRPPFERKVKQEVKQKAPLINNVVPINGARKEIIDSHPEGFIGVMS